MNFCCGRRDDGTTDGTGTRGVLRGPRGPKNLVVFPKDWFNQSVDGGGWCNGKTLIVGRCKFTEPRQLDAPPMPRRRQAERPPPAVAGNQSQATSTTILVLVSLSLLVHTSDWCQVQMFLPAGCILVLFVHLLVWFLLLGGVDCCWVQGSSQWN